MKRTTKRMRAGQQSVIELDLITKRCKERPLSKAPGIRLLMLNNWIAAVPGLKGFHFSIREQGDVDLFQIGKHGQDVITGAVVCGDDDLLFAWLVAYRARYLFGLPETVWTFPRITRYPWSAYVLSPLIATLPHVERRRVDQFRKKLVDALILGKAN